MHPTEEKYTSKEPPPGFSKTSLNELLLDYQNGGNFVKIRKILEKRKKLIREHWL